MLVLYFVTERLIYLQFVNENRQQKNIVNNCDEEDVLYFSF